MKCPYCGHLGDKVVDSRESKEGEVIRRRRECLECGRRFTSYERIDEIPVHGRQEGRPARAVRAAEAGRRAAQGVREAAGARRRARGDRRQGRSDACRKSPSARSSTEEIGAYVMQELQAPRQGRVRAIRVGVPELPRPRRVQGRAERAAQDDANDAGRGVCARGGRGWPRGGARRCRPTRSGSRRSSPDGRVLGVVRGADGVRRRHARGRARAACSLTFTFDVELRRPSTVWFDSHARRASRVASSVKFDNLTGALSGVKRMRDGRVVRSEPSDQEPQVRDWMTTFERVALEPRAAARAERRLLRARAAARDARGARSRSGRSGRSAATTRSGRADFTFIR